MAGPKTNNPKPLQIIIEKLKSQFCLLRFNLLQT